jgi:hypothetical protein
MRHYYPFSIAYSVSLQLYLNRLGAVSSFFLPPRRVLLFLYPKNSTAFLTHAEILVSFISVSFKRALGVNQQAAEPQTHLFIVENQIISNLIPLQD